MQVQVIPTADSNLDRMFQKYHVQVTIMWHSLNQPSGGQVKLSHGRPTVRFAFSVSDYAHIKIKI